MFVSVGYINVSLRCGVDLELSHHAQIANSRRHSCASQIVYHRVIPNPWLFDTTFRSLELENRRRLQPSSVYMLYILIAFMIDLTNLVQQRW